MTNLPAIFAELVRRAAVQLRLYCQHCAAEQMHKLAGETALDEIYECCRCGNQVTYRVR